MQEICDRNATEKFIGYASKARKSCSASLPMDIFTAMDIIQCREGRDVGYDSGHDINRLKLMANGFRENCQICPRGI